MNRITLATLPEATEQEVFDYVATHLLTQNQKAQTPNGSCRYRVDGLSCAAGCLIADEEYDEKVMEERSWGLLWSKERVPSTHSELISKLQRVHDQEPVSMWRACLVNIAYLHNLNPTIPEQF